MSRRLLRAAAGAAAALALVLLPAAVASAHDYLVSSDPAKDATVSTAVRTVTLRFNDRVLDLSGNGTGTLLTVTGPDGGSRHYETGCPAIADTTVSAPTALGAAGNYTVTYQIVSADGHTVSDSYAFTYQPPAGTPQSAGSVASPCGAKTGSAAVPAPTATEGVSTPLPTRKPESSTLGLVIGIAVAIVVLALAAVIVIVVTARRRPAAPERRAPDGDEGGA